VVRQTWGLTQRAFRGDGPSRPTRANLALRADLAGGRRAAWPAAGGRSWSAPGSP